jgi:hypothetical protein
MTPTKLLFTIIGIILFINIVTLFFNFFGIQISSYINFLMWFLALVLFYFILPKQKENIFV